MASVYGNARDKAMAVVQMYVEQERADAEMISQAFAPGALPTDPRELVHAMACTVTHGGDDSTHRLFQITADNIQVLIESRMRANDTSLKVEDLLRQFVWMVTNHNSLSNHLKIHDAALASIRGRLEVESATIADSIKLTKDEFFQLTSNGFRGMSAQDSCNLLRLRKIIACLAITYRDAQSELLLLQHQPNSARIREVYGFSVQAPMRSDVDEALANAAFNECLQMWEELNDEKTVLYKRYLSLGAEFLQKVADYIQNPQICEYPQEEYNAVMSTSHDAFALRFTKFKGIDRITNILQEWVQENDPEMLVKALNVLRSMEQSLCKHKIERYIETFEIALSILMNRLPQMFSETISPELKCEVVNVIKAQRQEIEGLQAMLGLKESEGELDVEEIAPATLQLLKNLEDYGSSMQTSIMEFSSWMMVVGLLDNPTEACQQILARVHSLTQELMKSFPEDIQFFAIDQIKADAQKLLAWCEEVSQHLQLDTPANINRIFQEYFDAYKDSLFQVQKEFKPEPQQQISELDDLTSRLDRLAQQVLDASES